MSNAKLFVFLKKYSKYKNVKLLKWMSEKVAHGRITYKDETLFELDEDDRYVTYYTIYYIMFYYFILYYILNNYKQIVTSDSFSSNYIGYESNDALFVKEYLNHTYPNIRSNHI